MSFDEHDREQRPYDAPRSEMWSTDEEARAEERRREYVAEALDEPDALDASMRMVGARLMSMNAFASASFEAGLAQLGATPEGFAALRPLIDTTIKTASILERLSNFQERRQQEARRKQSAYRRPGNSH